jgi:CRISPR/Cas system-associated protein endoribonuclease Cas2
MCTKHEICVSFCSTAFSIFSPRKIFNKIKLTIRAEMKIVLHVTFPLLLTKSIKNRKASTHISKFLISNSIKILSQHLEFFVIRDRPQFNRSSELLRILPLRGYIHRAVTKKVFKRKCIRFQNICDTISETAVCCVRSQCPCTTHACDVCTASTYHVDI